jgi:hypothetical protein
MHNYHLLHLQTKEAIIAGDQQVTDMSLDSVTVSFAHGFAIDVEAPDQGGFTRPEQKQTSNTLLRQSPLLSLSLLLIKQRFTHGHHIYFWATLTEPDPPLSLLKTMAKTDKRQAKVNPQLKCQDSSCMATFGQNSERHRHVKEKHGPRIYCCVPDCKRSVARKARLRTHLDNVHFSEGISNPCLTWHLSLFINAIYSKKKFSSAI